MNPCFNQGICFDNYGSYTCQCQPGFGGINCEIVNICIIFLEYHKMYLNVFIKDLNECISYPCQNGGQCRGQVGTYECRCAPGFMGRNCEINVNDCESASCPENSICVDGVASYTCHCKLGYIGNYLFRYKMQF